MTHDKGFSPLGTQGISLSVLLLFAHAASAQTVAAEAPGVSGTSIVQMLLGLTLIVAILFAGAYLLRRLNGGHHFGQTGTLKVVGGLMLSPRERIVLIEVGESWLVVGIVPGQIKTLHTLPKGVLPQSDNSAKPFGQWLKQMTERSNEKN